MKSDTETVMRQGQQTARLGLEKIYQGRGLRTENKEELREQRESQKTINKKNEETKRLRKREKRVQRRKTEKITFEHAVKRNKKSKL